MQPSRDVQTELVEHIAGFTHDPLGYAEFAFPWGEEGPLQDKSIRQWQMRVLHTIGEHLRNPETRYMPCRIAVASGHGIGKSALMGMISKWALDTMTDTRIVCTANTEGQLRTKTAPEVSKWHRMAITSDWFSIQGMSITSKDKDHAKHWRMDFTPWSKENTEAFQGLHNEGRRIVLFYDEGSGVVDEIWEVSEGAQTDELTEIIWIVFSNPTRNVGRFRECFRRFKALWKTLHVDSRDVEGTNKALFEEWAKPDVYGEDSDFFRIRVMGQFPRQSAYQMFSMDDIEGAWGKHLDEHQYSFAPKILAVDPAWTGDDLLTIGLRQGLYYRILDKIPKNDNDIQIANKLARYEDEHDADAVFVDGGYGTGIVSAGRTMGRDWNLVWFGEKATRVDCFNKRAEMYVEVRDWLKAGGAIPKDQMLYDEMIAIETVPTLDGKYKLPSKEDVKELIGWSPNCIDNLAITFAFPVLPRGGGQMEVIRNLPQREPYDPMARA